MTDAQVLAAARRLPQVLDHPRLNPHLQRFQELGLTVSAYVFSEAPDAAIVMVVHDKGQDPKPETLIRAYREAALRDGPAQGNA
ncbi:MAG: hypothetical protein AB1761_17740 [Pseudomonadota bacterium]